MAEERVHALDTQTALVVTLALTVTGTIIFKLLPLVVGAAAETFAIGYDKLGLLASSDLLGITIASLVMPLWVRRFDWRRAAIAALCLVVLGNVVSALVNDFQALLAVRMLTGLGEGTATGLGLVILGDMRKPDRAFGLAMASPIFLGLIGFQVLPPVIAAWGFDGVMLGLALVSSLILLALRWLPRSGRRRPPQAGHGSSDFVAVFAALIGTALYHLALGAVWAFIERMGKSAGLSPAYIGDALGLAVVCGLAGALLATVLGIRWGRSLPMLVAVTVQMLVLLLLVDDVQASVFFTATCLFQLSWLFSGPYQLGVIARADLSGRFFTLTIAFQAAGITLGPMLAGVLLEQYGFVAVRWLATAGMLAGIALLVPVARRYREPAPHSDLEAASTG